MHKVIIITFVGFFGLITYSQTPAKNDSKTVEINTLGLLRHVVLFKFNQSATEQEVTDVEQAFASLPQAITQIHDFEWGLNNSPEKLNKEFTHSFFVTFTSEEDREIYLVHPKHLAFVEILKPHLDDVLVIDYWTK